MGTGVRRRWSEAEQEAQEFKARFPTNLYERWTIAGSIRRQKPDIGDVEHVIIPKLGTIPDPNSLYPSAIQANLLFHWLDLRYAEAPDDWPKHNYNYDAPNPDSEHHANYKWGPLYRGIDYKGFGHELFLADTRNWGYILWLRTGSKEHNMRVAQHINKQTRLHLDGGYLRYNDGKGILDCPDEETFFRHIGLQFLPPEKRTA